MGSSSQQSGSSFERLVTNVLVIIGDVISLITYLPNALYSFSTVQASKRIRAQVVSKDGNSITYQHVDSVGKSLQQTLPNSVYYNDSVNVADFWRIAVERFKQRDCCGYRVVEGEEDEIQPNGKVFQKLKLGGYVWQTYEEIDHQADALGRALHKMVMENGSTNNIVIFSETRLEWMVAFMACAKYNLTVVTLYATLSEEAVVHGIVESEATILVASADGLCKIKHIGARADCAKVNTIVWFPNQINKVTAEMFPSRLTILTYNEAIEVGQDLPKIDVSPAKTDDIAVIMYTSGSTGLPKGVMLTQRNMIAVFRSLVEYIDGLGIEDTYIGYLPMAHVLELTCECICIFNGTRIGYSSAFTLSDKSTKIKSGGTGDATVLRPTLITAVPLVMDRIYKGVLDMVHTMPFPKRVLFNFALRYKSKQVARFFPTPFVDWLVFRKIRNTLGGRVRVLLSGGAPLSASTHEFMKICFSCPVIQGYGLTETTGGVTVVDIVDCELGQVGGPTKTGLLKLVNWEEGSYTVNDKPHPRGEIVIASPQVASGYYKQPDKTEEAFIVDPQTNITWFHSGDIGEVDELGRFKIIDRKKDLVKLAGGEYVSLGKVEMIVKTNKYVENVCVYADSSEMYTVMLAVPNEKNLLGLASEMGVTGTVEELCENKQVIQRVLKEIQTHCDGKKLDKLEMPQKLTLTPNPWTPDTGLVTDSFKLKRKELARVFGTQFAAMYGK